MAQRASETSLNGREIVCCIVGGEVNLGMRQIPMCKTVCHKRGKSMKLVLPVFGRFRSRWLPIFFMTTLSHSTWSRPVKSRRRSSSRSCVGRRFLPRRSVFWRRFRRKRPLSKINKLLGLLHSFPDDSFTGAIAAKMDKSVLLFSIEAFDRIA